MYQKKDRRRQQQIKRTNKEETKEATYQQIKIEDDDNESRGQTRKKSRNLLINNINLQFSRSASSVTLSKASATESQKTRIRDELKKQEEDKGSKSRKISDKEENQEVNTSSYSDQHQPTVPLERYSSVTLF